MFLIKKGDVLNIAEQLGKDHLLYGPMVEPQTGQAFFDRAGSAAAINLQAPIPSNPPKSVVFPQMDRIMKYTYDRGKKEARMEAGFEAVPKALFGLRSCDLEGMLCLDRFFLGHEFVDEVYRNHRKNMFIVTNTCTAPFPQCFCVCTDSGPAAKEGFDLNLTDLGDEYLVETGSEKGKVLAGKLGLKAAGNEHADEKRRRVDKSISLFEGIAVESKAWISRVMNRVTTGFIKEDIWEYIGDQCFECGACTFVCPSCSCFNVVDVADPSCEGCAERLRTWDSCSYEGYSRMAGGHNPRKPVEDRRNKRFFCKLSYSQMKKYLRPGCVGCGRCAWVCPGDIGLPNVVIYIRREVTGREEA